MHTHMRAQAFLQVLGSHSDKLQAGHQAYARTEARDPSRTRSTNDHDPYTPSLTQ
jgi:hypothetical protein